MHASKLHTFLIKYHWVIEKKLNVLIENKICFFKLLTDNYIIAIIIIKKREGFIRIIFMATLIKLKNLNSGKYNTINFSKRND